MTVSGELHSETQAFDFARGWRWSDAEAEGWDQPGFDAHSFEPLKAGGDTFTAPDGDAVVLRRVIAVPDRRERFWPVEAGLNLPRKSEMFVKPLFNWVGEVPGDYTYCLDLPEPIKIIAHDNLDGVPLAPMEETSITRDGQPYTRYRLSPVGSLISGFTLELLWKNEAGTQMIILMNPKQGSDRVTVTIRNLPRNAEVVEYETGREYDPLQPIDLDLQRGEIRVLHVTGG